VGDNVPHRAEVLDRDLHRRLALRLRLDEPLRAYIPIGLRHIGYRRKCTPKNGLYKGWNSKPGTQEKSINNATVLMMASRGAFFRDVTGEVTSPGHFANEAEN
jgi:hypothetical protein